MLNFIEFHPWRVHVPKPLAMSVNQVNLEIYSRELRRIALFLGMELKLTRWGGHLYMFLLFLVLKKRPKDSFFE